MPRKPSSNPVQQDERKILSGRVVLYRRRDGNDNWHYRFWVKTAGKYIRKSTGTPLFDEASKDAQKAFYSAIAKEENELPVFDKTFGEIFDLAIKDEKRKLDRGELSQRRYDFLNRIYKLYYQPFFGKRSVGTINRKMVLKYWDYRMDFWKQPDADKIRKKFKAMRIAEEPAGSTLHLEKRVLDMVLNKAVELNYMNPTLKPNTAPNAKNEKESRPALTMEQWEKMSKFMSDVYIHESGSHCNEKKRTARTVLYYYCVTMISTGLRVADMRNVKWKDLSTYKDQTGATYTELLVHGKNNVRSVVAQLSLYTLLMEWRNHTLNKYTKDTDFIFPNHNGKAIRDQGQIFHTMQANAEKTEKYSGISEDYLGDPIVIYSLRHSYATFQRKYVGTSFDDLATNMGTSVKILEKHYVDVKAPDIAKRLSGLSVTMGSGKERELKQELKIELDHKMFGDSERKQELMVQLLDNKITKEEYSKLSKQTVN